MTAPLTGNLLDDLKTATSPELFDGVDACLTQQLARLLSGEAVDDGAGKYGNYECACIIGTEYGYEYQQPMMRLWLQSGFLPDGPEGHAEAVKRAEALLA